MKKLSQQFLELSQHAATVENQAESIRAENRQEFAAHVSESRARAQSLRAAFVARLNAAEAALAAPWMKPSPLRLRERGGTWTSG